MTQTFGSHQNFAYLRVSCALQARKIKTYGGLTFRKCICDFPEPESKVFVSLDLSKLIIRELEGAE